MISDTAPLLGNQGRNARHCALKVEDFSKKSPEKVVLLKKVASKSSNFIYTGGKGEPKSIPVGPETVIDMYPLDFEEFLWANGFDEPVIEVLKKHLETEIPIPEAIIGCSSSFCNMQ